MTVFHNIPHKGVKGVYNSPFWQRGTQCGGYNSYILMPGNMFHLPGYGGVDLVSVQTALGSLRGHTRWYVMRYTIEYGLAQPATDNNTLGDWVEQLGAFKHFGLELP